MSREPGTSHAEQQPDQAPNRMSDVNEFVRSFEEKTRELQKTVSRGFRGQMIATVITVLMFIASAYIISEGFIPSEPQRNALNSLEEVGTKLDGQLAELRNLMDVHAHSEITGPIQTLSTDPQILKLLSESFLSLSAVRESVYEVVRAPLPSQIAIGQIVPLGAVVVILGFLGLRRMQGYDQEIAAARKDIVNELQFRFNSFHEQVTDRHNALADSVEKDVTNVVRAQFAEQQERIDTARKQFDCLYQESIDKTQQVQAKLESIMVENPWLREASSREWVDRVNALTTADQAHDVAQEFRSHENRVGARAALERILGDDNRPPLGGTADAFHNSFIEAVRLDDRLLAKAILEVGLTHHTTNIDLIADLVQVTSDLGDDPPRTELDRIRATGAYWRNWRPVVFESQAIANDGSHENVKKAIELLEEGVQRIPRDPKIWRNLAGCYRQIGDEQHAEEALRRGLQQSPHSQVLAYSIGEMLLAWGRPQEAVEFLERAMHSDYQDQFQSDVSQAAVMLTTAQGYEACQRYPEAIEVYQRFDHEASAQRIELESFQLLKYARARLALLGAPLDDEGEEPSREELFAQLEENGSQLELTVFSQAIVDLAGPPIDRDRALRLLDCVKGERSLTSDQYEQLRKMILEKYQDDDGFSPQ